MGEEKNTKYVFVYDLRHTNLYDTGPGVFHMNKMCLTRPVNFCKLIFVMHISEA